MKKIIIAATLVVAILIFGCLEQPSTLNATVTAAASPTVLATATAAPIATATATPTTQPTVPTASPTAKPTLQPGGAYVPEVTATPSPTPVPTATATPLPAMQVFYINASQWQFNPDRITVKAGTPVRLIVQALDSGIGQGHGISIENSDWGFHRSLQGPDFNPLTGKKDKYYPVTIDFIPTPAGTYTYYTQVPTGSGTASEKGTLIVTD